MAEHLLQVGEAMAKAGVGTAEQTIAIYEKAKAIWDRECGEGHVSTARCLAGIAGRYIAKGTQFNSQDDLQKGLEYGQQGLAVAERAGKGEGIEAESALLWIGEAHFKLKQYDEALEHRERRLRLLLAHFGEEGAKKEARVAEAYKDVGDVYAQGRGDFDRALEYYTKAVPVAEEATGKLSHTTGMLCRTTGVAYYQQQRYAEAVPWFERAVAAYTFTHGAENEQYTKRAVQQLERAKQQGAAQQQV